MTKKKKLINPVEMLRQIQIKHINKVSDKINKLIKSKGKYIWYVIIDDEVKLVANGKTIKDSKNEVYSKISTDDKFIGSPFYLVTMVLDNKIIGNNTFTRPGAFNIFTKKYILNKKNKLINKNSYGTVWFSDENILKYGFKTSFLKDILKSIDNDEVETNIVDMTTFDKFIDKEENYRD